MHLSKLTSSARRRLSRRLLLPAVALLSTTAGLGVAATPASAATRCALNYQVVSNSILYKGCATNVVNGTIKVNGLIQNNHGSTILVWYEFGYRDLTANTTTWYNHVFGPQQVAARGPWLTTSSRNFACVPGHSVRGLMRASANGVWGPVSESSTITC